jgi:4,5-DOPA dioxygenase extradiol
MEPPPTIHDFGGFPQALFDSQYPANGNPVLAKETQTLLMPTPVELDEKWGLDHGTWTVLRHFYPKADVPVIQLSIDYSKPAAYHFELATRLAILRHKGILIMGSGNIIHNLRLVDFANINKDNYGYDWAIEARETLNNLIINGDFKSLMNYEKLGRAVQLAIPTPDHYLPLIYALGLKSKDDKVSFVNDKLLGGSLSMTSLKIDVS